MKKSWFISLFIATHIAFIFIQIHQYSRTIKASYQKQTQEQRKIELEHTKQGLLHQWYLLQNKAAIKKFAQEELKLVPLRLSRIKKIPSSHDHTV